MRYRRCVILGFFVAVFGLADPPRAAGREFAGVKEARVESGVPLFSVLGPESIGLSTTPHDLKRLPDGRIFVLANDEIALGDGVRWEVYRRAEAEPRGPASAQQMLVSADGTLYGGIEGGLARVVFQADRTWRFVPEVKLPSPWDTGARVCSLATDTGGRWLWSWGSGPIFSWQPGGAIELLGEANAIEATFTLDGQPHASDQSSGQAFRLEAGRSIPVDLGILGYVEKTVTSSANLTARQTLLGTVQRGLLLRETGGSLSFFSQLSLTRGDHRINDLALIGDDYVGVALDGVGIAFLNRAGLLVQVLDRSVDHRLASVRRLLPSPNGIVWGLLNDGVVRIGFPHPVSHFGPLMGTTIRHPQPYRHQDRLWLMSNGSALQGIYDKDGRLLRFEVNSPDSYLTAMLELDGTFLANTLAGVFQWREAAGWEPAILGPNSPHISPRESAPGRYLYVAQDEYGWIVKEGSGFKAERKERPGLGHVYDSLIDTEGNLWGELGSGRVVRVKPTFPEPTLEVFDQSRGLFNSWTQLYRIDSQVRVNMDGALLRFDSNQERFVADTLLLKERPFLEGAMGRLNTDAFGQVWFTHHTGVQILPPLTVGGRPRTLPAGGIRPNYYIAEADGVMWLSELKRLARYDPRIRTPPLERPEVLLTRVDFADGTSVRAPADRSLGVVKGSANSLTVHFVCPNLPFGEAVTFESKLEGSDDHWTPLGAQGAIVLNRLGAGEYRLLVRGKVGTLVGTPAELSFTLPRPWFLTRTAWASYALALVGLVIGASRLSTYRAKREQHRLERQVAARTAELNEANQELAKKIKEVVEQNEQRRALEAQMHQIQRVESVGKLAGGIAHDFNNMLTGMLGFCELATLSVPPQSEAASYLREITANGLRAKDLISRILIYSRKGESHLLPIDLADPVRDALKLLQASLPASVQLTHELSSVPVLGDVTQIHQIVLNLGTNAVHAIGDRAGRIHVRLRQVDEPWSGGATPELRAQPHALLEVTDNGCGIDPETLDKIFEPFFTTKEPGKGTGLGLSTVQGIVANHSGLVRARSDLGRGSTFEVLIPVTLPQKPSEGETGNAATPPAEVVVGPKAELLVVDDEPAVARSTAAMLKHLGYDVKLFTDPLQALEYGRHNIQALGALVTDLNMPKMTGLELTSALLELRPELPVLLVSGYVRPHRDGTEFPGRRTTLLAKPFRLEELKVTISRVLGILKTEPSH